jgi:hypothetical protein
MRFLHFYELQIGYKKPPIRGIEYKYLCIQIEKARHIDQIWRGRIQLGSIASYFSQYNYFDPAVEDDHQFYISSRSN